MPTTTQTRNIQINKSQKEDTAQMDAEPHSVFFPTWESHSRLWTNSQRTQDDIWPITSDSFYKTRNNDSLVHIKNEGDVFQVVVESADFKPEELKVSTLDENLLKIDGMHVEESRPENGNKYVSRQFSRSYILPVNCKVHQMQSSFNNGKLVVTVPKTKPAIQDESNGAKEKAKSVLIRCIPIQSQEKFCHSGDAYKTRRVKINHDICQKADVTHTDTNGNTSLDCPTTSLLTNQLDNWKLGQSAFRNWIRPIQILDEDFFTDICQRPNGLFNRTQHIDLNNVKKSASKVEIKETEDQFQFILPTDSYHPKELKVSVVDDVLKIDGQHVEEGSSDERSNDKSHVNKRKVTKQFSKSYVLPKHIYKMDQIESSLDNTKKVLVVKVPKIRPEKQMGNKSAVNVPIKMI